LSPYMYFGLLLYDSVHSKIFETAMSLKSIFLLDKLQSVVSTLSYKYMVDKMLG
jgi:hypothetical protein